MPLYLASWDLQNFQLSWNSKIGRVRHYFNWSYYKYYLTLNTLKTQLRCNRWVICEMWYIMRKWDCWVICIRWWLIREISFPDTYRITDFIGFFTFLPGWLQAYSSQTFVLYKFGCDNKGLIPIVLSDCEYLAVFVNSYHCLGDYFGAGGCFIFGLLTDMCLPFLGTCHWVVKTK